MRVFPRLDFDSPMGIFEAPDSSNRFVLIQRDGRVRIFPNIPDPDPNTDVSTFFDIGSLLGDVHGELGLLGFAFDPDYATNGEVYVH